MQTCNPNPLLDYSEVFIPRVVLASARFHAPAVVISVLVLVLVTFPTHGPVT